MLGTLNDSWVTLYIELQKLNKPKSNFHDSNRINKKLETTYNQQGKSIRFK